MSGTFAVVQGCSKGLGHSFARLLLARTDLHVVGLTHCGASDVKKSLLSGSEKGEERLTTLDVDVTKEEQVKAASEEVEKRMGRKLGVLVNFAGMLQPEKNLASVDLDTVRRTFEVNTFGHLAVFKHFLPLVPRSHKSERAEAAKEEQEGEGETVGLGMGRSVLASVTARVGSIGDNKKGGWYSYRASKAATNQIVRTLALELRLRQLPAVAIAYHPGTMKTELAGEFAEGREPSEAEGLFEPDQAAEKLLAVLKSVKGDENGQFFDWKRERVPW